MVHDRIMVGGVVAFDDTWDNLDKLRKGGVAERPESTGHLGHGVLVHELLSGGDYAPLLVGGMLKSDVDRALRKEATESGFRKFVDTVGRRPPRKTSVIHKVRSRLAPVDAARGGLQQHARISVTCGALRTGGSHEEGTQLLDIPELAVDAPVPAAQLANQSRNLLHKKQHPPPKQSLWRKLG